MVNSAANQYAKAIFDIAVTNKCEENYYNTLTTIVQCFIENNEMYNILSHPKLSKDNKKKIFKDVLTDKVDSDLLYYLYVLIDNNRILDLDTICEAYKILLNQFYNQLEVDVYTKYQLDRDNYNNIQSVLSKHYRKKIIINEHLDQNLSSGIKIIANGQIIDGTLLTKLNNIKLRVKRGW